MRKSTHCISTMLPPVMADGAKLSWLIHPALRFLKPKNFDRRGEDEAMLATSENDAIENARGMAGDSGEPESILAGLECSGINPMFPSRPGRLL